MTKEEKNRIIAKIEVAEIKLTRNATIHTYVAGIRDTISIFFSQYSSYEYDKNNERLMNYLEVMEFINKKLADL